MRRDISTEFIEWALTQLEDDDFYETLLAEVIRHAEAYYARPKEQIVGDLALKLARGAKEHGDPIYPAHRIYDELTMEYTDLLGWTLIGLYNSTIADEQPRTKPRS